ncbi:MAG: hydantoinase/oxoprolinase family protein, partial [Alphaproteobacteria bacterium]|nr:hydantoinase/oxoprolinase family protein [Alphaproteobacteria bacterium]
RYSHLAKFEPEGLNKMFTEMHDEAQAIVTSGAPGAELEERRIAYMRYIGQGHEIVVEVPARALTVDDGAVLRAAYDKAYEALFGRDIPSMEVEILTWALSVSTILPPPPLQTDIPDAGLATVSGERRLFDADLTDFVSAPVYQRDDLLPGMTVQGPAIIAEDQTTTAVTGHFQARIDAAGHIEITRKVGDAS